MKQSQEMFDYNCLVHKARTRFHIQPGINFFLTQSDKKQMHAFLLTWTALSVSNTQPVEGWIRRAGNKCIQLGYNKIGQRLVDHSRQEADHDKMLVEDLEVLVQLWNQKYENKITTKELLSLELPQSTKDYVTLHENVINSDEPFRQVAIEFEIERISVNYGPRMLESVMYSLGREFTKGLGFLAEHVELDVGHTAFNLRLLDSCFKENKAWVNSMAETGSTALNIYGQFLNDCVVQCQKISQQKLDLSEVRKLNQNFIDQFADSIQ
ncbi:MAG: hypothetical protein H6625_10560 [Bdellovibrionaceae bacterium]|nr:hypothetical protein [Pseudobdellovibrionaceae bacterium]